LSPRIATGCLLLVLALLTATAPTAGARVPRDFFGIVPQTPLGAEDTNRMRSGGVDLIRAPVSWASIQPTPAAVYHWSALDDLVANAARSGIGVVPFLYATPRWLSRRPTVLPVDNARQRRAWTTFVRAAVERYGRGGLFWSEHSRASGDFVPPHPVTTWQIWNEENFFYFTTPVSPGRYARLLKLSRGSIKGADRRADIVIGGLFGNPKGRPPRAMDAADFLDRLYAVRGIKRTFDGVALHPYAPDVGELAALTERLRAVVRRNGDARTGLYLTEIGWGSQRNPRRVAFEVGLREQARELRGAYRYLIGNQRRLNLEQVHWFTWKDAAGQCSFCDSTGLFRRGARFKPKPAWHAFVRFAR
jgi:Beta-galactosidase